MFEPRVILEDRGPEFAPLPDVPLDYDPANDPDSWDEHDWLPADTWIDGVANEFTGEPDPDERIWIAEHSALGANTLTLLTLHPFDQLSPPARSDALALLTRLGEYVEALKLDAVAAIAGPPPVSERARRDDFTPEEVAIATDTSIYAADTQIAAARDLHGRLSATGQALRDATITAAQARKLCQATAHLSDDIAQQVEAKMLKFSHRQTLTLFCRALDRWLAKLDPDWTSRANEARRAVIVEHTTGKDGTGALYVRGPLEDTLNIHNALAAYAARTKDQLGGTADARKFAGLRDWAETALTDPDSPTVHGRTPTVNVTIDLATLLGLRNGIAEIPGVGAIPSAVAAWLLADGAPLRRLVIDPLNGQLLDYGTDTYTVTPALADLLIARNITSATPNSTVPAAGCDMEHNIPHQHGGPTNPINVTPVERRWHRAKTHGNWTYQKHPDTGVVTWTSPTSGLTCVIDPYDYRASP